MEAIYRKRWVAEELIPFLLAFQAQLNSGHSDELSRNPNVTLDIIRQYSSLQWDFYLLSQNPGITMDMVEASPELPWNYAAVSANPNLTMDMLQRHPELPWDFKAVSFCPRLTMEVLLLHHPIEWDFWRVTRNPAISLAALETHPQLPWHRGALCDNPNVTLAFVRAHSDWGSSWSWPNLSQNPGISVAEMLASPDLPWRWDWASSNPTLRAEQVLGCPEQGWHWGRLSRSSCVTLGLLRAFADRPWDWDYLTRHPNLAYAEILEAMRELPFRPAELLLNPSLTLANLQRSRTSLCSLWMNPNISMGMINWLTVAVERGRLNVPLQLAWRRVARYAFSADREAYVARQLRRLALLSLMDEDYAREEGELDRCCPVDLVFQSEAIVSRMAQYV
jgi:hypothetical protein